MIVAKDKAKENKSVYYKIRTIIF